MSLKKIITIILSLFVAVSVVYLISNELSSNKTEAENSSKNGIIHKDDNTLKDVNNNRENKIIIYYFYTNYRCKTCLNIEKYTAEAVTKGFKDQLKASKILWKPLNMEEMENHHYQKEFELYTKSVIIEEKSNDKRIRWKNLEKIWELVRDKEEFIKYIQDEVKKYLEKA